MDNPHLQLKTFREQLQALMSDPKSRPFVCDGSPLTCGVFIVGFNPATEMDQPFWAYWSDTSGFDKGAFMRDYLAKRELSQPKGVRARIEKIVSRLPRRTCLETNICSKPTKTAAELASADRTTAIFRFLLDTIRPHFIYVHSNDPIDYFHNLTGIDGFDSGLARKAAIQDHRFLLLGTRGPLFRMGFSDAEDLGDKINVALGAR